MNDGKVGPPYGYPDSIMTFIAISRALIDTGYRQCEDYLKAVWGTVSPSVTLPYDRGWAECCPGLKRTVHFSLPKTASYILFPTLLE